MRIILIILTNAYLLNEMINVVDSVNLTMKTILMNVNFIVIMQ